MWSLAGDMGHLAVCLNAAAFAYMVIFERESGMFDPSWTKDGFCVTNRDIPYWNSHDLCLYFDTVGAVVLGLVYWKLRGMPGMEEPNTVIKFNVFGVFGHGLGHVAVGNAMREGLMFNEEDEKISRLEKILSSSLLQLAVTLGPFVLFWMFLMKAAVPKSSLKMNIPMALVAAFFGALVPDFLSFTYTQTVLLFAASVSQVARPAVEKDMAYGLFPFIVALPLMMIGWLESGYCNKIIDVGGHLLYDAYIPSSLLIYYFVCYHVVQTQQKSKVA